MLILRALNLTCAETAANVLNIIDQQSASAHRTTLFIIKVNAKTGLAYTNNTIATNTAQIHII